jgi:hypothetical protein
MATTTTDTSHRAGDARSDALSRELLVLGGVFVLGAIMTVFDLTIVNVAVPTIGRDLDTSISTIQWVITELCLSPIATERQDARPGEGSLSNYRVVYPRLPRPLVVLPTDVVNAADRGSSSE